MAPAAVGETEALRPTASSAPSNNGLQPQAAEIRLREFPIAYSNESSHEQIKTRRNFELFLNKLVCFRWLKGTLKKKNVLCAHLV